MSVSIKFKFPAELAKNHTVSRALWNAAYFIRDLWLARAPYASGAYAKGLQNAGSVKVRGGTIEITNFAKHAALVEYGHRSFNLGLAMLNSGKGVSYSKDGNRYKRIHIDQKTQTRTRSPNVATQVKSSFQKTFPIGFPTPRITKYGAMKPYNPRRSLQRPLAQRGAPGGPRGFFTISEKAIRENPNKWQIPAREGKKLGLEVQKEGKQYVAEALRLAVQGERHRQLRMKGVQPKWARSFNRSILKAIPVRRGR